MLAVAVFTWGVGLERVGLVYSLGAVEDDGHKERERGDRKHGLHVALHADVERGRQKPACQRTARHGSHLHRAQADLKWELTGSIQYLPHPGLTTSGKWPRAICMERFSCMEMPPAARGISAWPAESCHLREREAILDEVPHIFPLQSRLWVLSAMQRSMRIDS